MEEEALRNVETVLCEHESLQITIAPVQAGVAVLILGRQVAGGGVTDGAGLVASKGVQITEVVSEVAERYGYRPVQNAAQESAAPFDEMSRGTHEEGARRIQR